MDRDPGSAHFPSLDCSLLNAPISRDEVRMSVYKARARKADEIPSGQLCVDTF